ncbi:MAG: three-Cys-motif partner protein TcmP [Fimbriimonadaceae bacterium]|nr:three-Cys-motif partner protein TcmP [Alphaproteobacteria bacterium]
MLSIKTRLFGVALDVLKRVKERLPNVIIKAVFCEERRKAFKELCAFLAGNSGNIDTRCFHGRFEDHIANIETFIGKQGFRFAFIDPTGWNVDVSAISPLLKDSWSEVLFNFMAEFIGRFPDFDKVRDAYSSLLGDVDWKSRFEALPDSIPNDEKVLQIFRDVLKEKWGFSHVLELPVRKAGRDRTFYKLVYGTRSPHGVLAFREAQAKAEKEGFAVEFEAKTVETGDLFSSDDHAEQIAASVGVGSRSNLARLQTAIMQHLRTVTVTNFLNLAGSVLETIPAREKDVRATVKAMSSMGALEIADPDRIGNPTRKSSIRPTPSNPSPRTCHPE